MQFNNNLKNSIRILLELYNLVRGTRFFLNEVFIYPLFSTCIWNYYTVYNHLLGNVRTT